MCYTKYLYLVLRASCCVWSMGTDVAPSRSQSAVAVGSFYAPFPSSRLHRSHAMSGIAEQQGSWWGRHAAAVWEKRCSCHCSLWICKSMNFVALMPDRGHKAASNTHDLHSFAFCKPKTFASEHFNCNLIQANSNLAFLWSLNPGQNPEQNPEHVFLLLTRSLPAMSFLLHFDGLHNATMLLQHSKMGRLKV